ncbi:MAG: DNA polymerase III subunit delta' [Desulfovibrio sp.]
MAKKKAAVEDAPRVNPLIGQHIASQQQVYDRMAKIASRPPQCLLLEGGTADEREALSLYWASLLNCSAVADPENSATTPCGSCPSCIQINDKAFSDLLFFDGRTERIKIDVIREVLSVWGQPPNGDGSRVTVFAEAQSLGVEAANSLLKTLEEPRPGNVFILTAPQRERLLETLVSRSWVLTLSWPQQKCCDEQMDKWVGAFLNFLQTGQGWFAHTSGKGAVDADIAMRVVLALQGSLKDAMSGSPTTTFGERFATMLGGGRMRRLYVALGQAQEALSLPTPVTPPLVLDWVATQMRK